MKTVAFHNLGCKVNTYEMDVMQQKFEEKGYKIVSFTTKSDIYVVNTCTVTNIADRKSRQMLHKAKKQNPDGIVVATGCYVQMDSENAILDDAIDVIVGNNNKARIVEIVEEHIEKMENKTTVIDDISVSPEYEVCSLKYSNERTRVDIKIQDGCNQFCTYCMIPYARGRIRSRALDDILDEVRVLAAQGFKEVVLTGIHLSSYGLDFSDNHKSYNQAAECGEYTNRELMEVIKSIAAIDEIRRIRLGSLEPRAITGEFLDYISSEKKVCPHFHLSLQSGCDETLKRMNRHYSTAEYFEKVALIRKYYPHPAITTDIITGFPGETDDEFEKTFEFVKSVDFYETHIFKYSRRKGTVADKMPGQLTDAVKSVRSDRLIELNDINSANFASYHIGKDVDILIEEEKLIDGKRYFTGHTEDYCMAYISDSDVCVNDVVIGEVTGIGKEGVFRGALLIERTDKIG